MVVSVEEVQLMRFFKDDPVLPEIVFTLKGYSIRGGDDTKGYKRLDRLIHDRKITVQRRINDAGFAAAADAASYFMSNNTFSLGSKFVPTGTFGKALLAHEGAHALIDLQNLGAINRGVSEAIAYFAEAMWLGLAGWTPIKAKGGGQNPVRAMAFAMAQAVANSASTTVPPADADALVNLIVAEKQYEDPNPHNSDGIG